MTLTRHHEEFYPLIRKAFLETGIIFVILPNIAGSKTNGATKKIGQNIMLMVNDRRLNADSFWFTLFHEIGHIINGDYGISFEKETGEQEEAANRINRDPGIVLGRLQNDKIVDFNDWTLNPLRHKYSFATISL